MTNETTVQPDPAITAKGYVHPDVLVSTEWVANNLNNPQIRLVESNEDILLYGQGHIPGAVHIDWQGDLSPSTASAMIRPWCFTATKITGGRRIPSGCSSYSVTVTRRSWTVDAPNGWRRVAL